MTDIQASLGLRQLQKLDGFLLQRERLAAFFQERLAQYDELELPEVLPARKHAYHLYPIRIRPEMLALDRSGFIEELKRRRIGASVHFIPLHRHPFYRDSGRYDPGLFPMAERIFAGSLSLPLYPRMTDQDAEDVVEAVADVIRLHRRPVFAGHVVDGQGLGSVKGE